MSDRFLKSLGLLDLAGNPLFVNLHQSNAPVNQSTRPSILGIWRLGDGIHQSRTSELTFAQPADSNGSPRWDYVLKCATGALEDAENVRQIVQFTTAASKAVHPNLIPVLDASITGASPYLVMPFIEGATLQTHFQGDPKPLPVALWLTRQVAQALAALHQSGWIHGDVKPENVIVGNQGHVTLIDLGFAAQIHTANGSQFRGTPEYAAPEVIQGNMAAMPAADIFSLGRMLWKSLTHTEATSETALAPVAQLIEQMVSDNPADRPTAEYVTDRLLRLEIDTLGHHIGPSPSITRGTGNVGRAA